MIIYNVTIKIYPDIEAEWLNWMQREHIPEVLATGYFDRAVFTRLLEPHDEEGLTFSVQYYTSTHHRYKQYIDEEAPKLRQKGFDRFGDRFIAFRSLMETID
jgi:hypothetical protein